MFRFACAAIHSGEFLNVPATGKKVNFTGMVLHRVADKVFFVTVINCSGRVGIVDKGSILLESRLRDCLRQSRR